MSAAPPSTLVILYPGCIPFEVILAADLLASDHPKLRVAVATPDGGDHRSDAGFRTRADLAWDAIDPTAHPVVLIPGGDPYEVMGGTTIDEKLRALEGAGAILGAICAGPVVLAKAGLLRGRRFTHGYGDAHREQLAPHWEGATFTDAAVERDGPIITAKAQAFAEFAATVFVAAGGNPEAAERKRAFYADGAPTPAAQR